MQSFAKNKPEILAPAGNMESLRAAVINGADAVYLGASAFSARAKAGNFTNEELVAAVEYCHLFGIKVYLAVNTLLKSSEYEAALNTVKYAKSIGVDAIIVQDIAFLSKFRSTMSDINVHLSTQAGIHNMYGAKVAERLGATRIILSREVSFEDIEEICKNTSLEVEVFVHGALCIGFSGNCYFSSMVSGLSGNRGRCLQLCRKEYSCKAKKGYLLSPADLDFSKKIDKLFKLGVKSFKIEGRMKRPEYVAEAVRCYREAIDCGSSNFSVLKGIFNRGGGCEGYLSDSTADLIYPKIQGHLGIEIGKVTKICGNTATLSVSKKLRRGDGLKFLRNGIEVGTSLVDADGVKVGYVGDVKSGDTVNVTTDTCALDEISKRERRLPVEISIRAAVNDTIRLHARCGDSAVDATSTFTLLQAQNAPLSRDDLYNVFSKTGETEFTLTAFNCQIDGNVFCRKSELNEFRRTVYATLKNKILVDYSIQNAVNIPSFNVKTLNFVNFAKVDFNTLVQVDDLALLDGLYEGYAVAYSPTAFSYDKLEKFFSLKKRKFLTLPPVLRVADLRVIEQLLRVDCSFGIIANNLSHLLLAGEREVIFGPLMNCINPGFDVAKILSFEYDGTDFGDNLAYVYGRVPLMTFAHCPRKTVFNGKCSACGVEIEYEDERKNSFPMRFFKVKNCYSQMLNSLPLCVFDKISKLSIKRCFLDLVGCDKQSATEVLQAFELGQKPVGSFTSGYFSKKLQ